MMAGKQAARKDVYDLNEMLAALGENVSRLQEGVGASAKGVRDAFAEGASSLKKMDDSLGGIRQYLAEKALESKRYQEGYDYGVLKNFCKQIIRSIHLIDGEMVDATDDEAAVLHGVRLDLIDLLDRNGIEEFAPALVI
jgi:hypothetical protein